MGTLAEEIAGEKKRPTGRKPILQQIADSLEGEERKDFVDAINNPQIPVAVLYRVLKKRGFDVNISTIYNYRLGQYRHEVR